MKLWIVFLSDRMEYDLVEVCETEELAKARVAVLNEMEGNTETPTPWKYLPVDLQTEKEANS